MAAGGGSGRTVVVGLLPEQPLWVVQVAAEYALAFDAALVCVTVDPSRAIFQELPDGTLLSAPIDPDVLAEDPPAFDAERLAAIGAVLDPVGVPWSVRELVGIAAEGLREAAEEVDALMIVVGARPGGLRSALRSMVAGSVAARLVHRQYRPVVVVPTAPDTADAALEEG